MMLIKFRSPIDIVFCFDFSYNRFIPHSAQAKPALRKEDRTNYLCYMIMLYVLCQKGKKKANHQARILTAVFQLDA